VGNNRNNKRDSHVGSEATHVACDVRLLSTRVRNRDWRPGRLAWIFVGADVTQSRQHTRERGHLQARTKDTHERAIACIVFEDIKRPVAVACDELRVHRGRTHICKPASVPHGAISNEREAGGGG
jgi:hypothetical protein